MACVSGDAKGMLLVDYLEMVTLLQGGRAYCIHLFGQTSEKKWHEEPT